MTGFRTGIWKLKRSLNNLAFRMSFIKLAPGSSRPLLPIASFLILGFTIFVLAGGLFVLVGAGPGAQGLVNRQSGLTFVYPGDVNNQTPQEGVLAMLLYALGLAGLYAMFMSTRYAYRPGRAYSLLTMGVVLTFVFIAVAYFVLYDKLGARF
ncbi:MAG TPA: hypothetical protein VI816_02290 [Candidatus Bathyarchaeia archaeon]|nr:hypothetical protein [Candidatus Bathyarchaeia archaeon]